MQAIILVAVMILGTAALLPPSDAFAQASQVQQGITDIGGNTAQPLTGVIKKVVDVLLYFVGALSVIMIIYGGFKYITSSGESSAVASAKNTILYSVIGLAIAALAFGIVNFVVDTVETTDPGEAGATTGEDARKKVDKTIDDKSKDAETPRRGSGSPVQ